MSLYPVIFGLEGAALSAREKSFFTEARPAGIILFARNIDTPDQVRGLVGELKATLGFDHLAVFIDQEGGHVQRLARPHWRCAPPMAFFGEADKKDPELAARALYTNIQLIGLELKELGISVNSVPVLDVPVKGADSIIGERALSNDADVVARLGAVAADALQSVGILAVAKHIPGHGRANVDSHKALPVVNASSQELEQTDFLPFKLNKDLPFAMTAHIIYSAIDAGNCATLSEKIIHDVIRGAIGFEGILISDDINMKALQGSYQTRAEKCQAAGIDLVLHCNGKMAEMEQVMAGLSEWDQEKRLVGLLENTRAEDVGDKKELLWHYEELEHKINNL